MTKLKDILARNKSHGSGPASEDEKDENLKEALEALKSSLNKISSAASQGGKGLFSLDTREGDAPMLAKMAERIAFPDRELPKIQPIPFNEMLGALQGTHKVSEELCAQQKEASGKSEKAFKTSKRLAIGALIVSIVTLVVASLSLCFSVGSNYVKIE